MLDSARAVAVVLFTSCAAAACGGKIAGEAPDGAGAAETSVGADAALADTGVDVSSLPDSSRPETERVDTAIDTAGDTGDLDTALPDTDLPDTTPAEDTATGDTGALDTGVDFDALAYPAAHPAAPQVVAAGGPVLGSPRLVPIVFDGDTWSSQLGAFTDTFASSAAADYWKATTAEYGVGPLRSAPLITLHETPPATLTNDEILTWLAGKLDGAHELGKPDPSAIYTIFYPSTTKITLAPGYESCVQFGAYHEEATAPTGEKVAYAVIPRCPPFTAALTDFEELTSSTSHEWIEAVTDPFGQSTPAYAMTDPDTLVWNLWPLGEVGDLCAQESAAFFKASFGYYVQRTWSNAAAAASHDPCVPAAGGEAYFNSAPVLDETVSIDVGTGPTPTKGVKIPVGTKKTIDVDLFSDAPTSGPWTVQAVDVERLLTGTPTLRFSFDRTTGVNGDKLRLTIEVLAAGSNGGSEFMLRSRLGATRHEWFGWVAN